ncbi:MULTISPECIES: TVP38/TMEM64 family protein [Nesterenkonia]|uniref:TVP38/TMEM64 family protein n=1 Tax=Nesterenkonia TaxID=57494 RepID=UPI0009FC49BC|nr:MULTISPECIES: TVP38/TMEM64 family protein [Nesterenkonia]
MTDQEPDRLSSATPDGPDSAAAASSGRRAAVTKAALLVLALAGFTAAALLLPLPALEEIRSLVAGAGWWGPFGFGIGYAALTLAPVPKNVLSIGAGVLFGFGPGLLIVYVAAMAGASAAFWLGRGLGREAVERFTGTRVAKVEAVLDRHGFAAVVGVRLVPVLPFTAINYSAGLTSLGWWPYVMGTLIGIIPGTASYLALGAYGFESGARAELAAAALGVLTLAGIAYAVRVRRRSTTTDV